MDEWCSRYDTDDDADLDPVAKSRLTTRDLLLRIVKDGRCVSPSYQESPSSHSDDDDQGLEPAKGVCSRSTMPTDPGIDDLVRLTNEVLPLTNRLDNMTALATPVVKVPARERQLDPRNSERLALGELVPVQWLKYPRNDLDKFMRRRDMASKPGLENLIGSLLIRQDDRTGDTVEEVETGAMHEKVAETVDEKQLPFRKRLAFELKRRSSTAVQNGIDGTDDELDVGGRCADVGRRRRFTYPSYLHHHAQPIEPNSLAPSEPIPIPHSRHG
ncbi:Uncharacterized protein PBTT_04321 [Plasmodiophora brassicae]|nr:hypothetical protein PBRA_000102 [Plasmodiophora brassicae]